MSTNRPDERQLEDLTPDEITAIQAALTAMAAGAAARPSIPGPTITGTGAGSAPAWLSQAQTTADRIVAGATAEGQAVHDRIVASAEAEVVVARQAAVEEVTARVGEIVLAAAERVIGREIKASDHQDLIDEAIAAVRAESTGAAAGAGGAR